MGEILDPDPHVGYGSERTKNEIQYNRGPEAKTELEGQK